MQVFVITKDDLGTLGFLENRNPRNPHEFFMIREPVKLVYHSMTHTLEVTRRVQPGVNSFKWPGIEKTEHIIYSLKELQELVNSILWSN